MAQIIDIVRHEDEIVAVLEYVEHDNLKACHCARGSGAVGQGSATFTSRPRFGS
jgi:hypothetical protein